MRSLEEDSKAFSTEARLWSGAKRVAVRPPPSVTMDAPAFRSRPLLGPRLRRWAPSLFIAAVLWVAAWGVAARRHRRPLLVDRWVDVPLLQLGPRWQRWSAHIIDSEHTVVAATLATLVVGALLRRRPDWAVTVVAALGAEVVSVQWLIKPLVHRMELAPAPSFPSSYVGLAAVTGTLAIIFARALLRGRAGQLAPLVVAPVAGIWLVALSVSTLITEGHRFSDVIAALPWGTALAIAACALCDAWQDRRTSRRSRVSEHNPAVPTTRPR